MALRALLLRRQIENARRDLEALRARDAEFATREAELTAAIDEVETDEQRSGVEELIAAYEAEKAEHQNAIGELERSISELETELAAEEAAQNTEPAAEPAAGSDGGGENNEERGNRNMENREHRAARALAFGTMTRAQINEIVQRDDVQNFLKNVRSYLRIGSQQSNVRSIENVGLTIPEVMLGLLRENVLRYSKLYGRVTVTRVSGETRILITGDIPEAVWTECCANLNALTMTFYQDSFGCWKLGGFFTVCNANLEDSDIDLMAEILSTIGQSIGYTDDKTILYGTGVLKPMGIIPRLAQTQAPSDYPATARPWRDLHETNIRTIANTYTGLALFQQIALAAGYAKGAYSRGEKLWVMNENTYGKIVAAAMSVDASGAITSGVNGTMPVIGGLIEVLPESIIPDNNILMGYFDLYRLVERAGEKYASSEHFHFLSDQTVFKGTVRWDGKPLIAEAFVLIGIDGTVPTTSAVFAGDTANSAQGILLPATATVAAGSTITLNPTILPYGVNPTLTWDSATKAKATVVDGVVTGVAAGTSVISVTTDNGYTATCTVTVTGE